MWNRTVGARRLPNQACASTEIPSQRTSASYHAKAWWPLALTYALLARADPISLPAAHVHRVIFPLYRVISCYLLFLFYLLCVTQTSSFRWRGFRNAKSHGILWQQARKLPAPLMFFALLVVSSLWSLDFIICNINTSLIANEWRPKHLEKIIEDQLMLTHKGRNTAHPNAVRTKTSMKYAMMPVRKAMTVKHEWTTRSNGTNQNHGYSLRLISVEDKGANGGPIARPM